MEEEQLEDHIRQSYQNCMRQLDACSSKQQQSSVWSSTALENYELSSGLELLTQVDCLLVHQQIELLEILTNWEARNRYRIKNSAGEQLLYATEESDVCARQCCGPQRSFIMHICDITGAEVLRVSRQLKCFACQPACFCSAGLEPCSHELQVEAPPGTVIARVRQQRSCMQPRYEIQDATGRSVLFIRGPKCICRGPCCTMEKEFKVYSMGMIDEIGYISKQWGGFAREYFTDADNYSVSFPADLDVRMKAAMVGAVFLIDFMFFENDQQSQH